MHGYIFQDILIHSINVHVLEYNDLIAAMGVFFTKKKILTFVKSLYAIHNFKTCSLLNAKKSRDLFKILK